MPPLKMNQVTDADTSDSGWKSLYRFGGVAALANTQPRQLGAGCLERRGESDWRYILMKVLIICDSVFANTEQKSG